MPTERSKRGTKTLRVYVNLSSKRICTCLPYCAGYFLFSFVYGSHHLFFQRIAFFPLCEFIVLCSLCLVESRSKWCKSRIYTHRKRARSHTYLARARIAELEQDRVGERESERKRDKRYRRKKEKLHKLRAFPATYMCTCVRWWIEGAQSEKQTQQEEK